MNMNEDVSFEEILNNFKSSSKKRDPRAVRLAAVTSALLDGIGSDCSAAKVYAGAVAALEGTLKREDDEKSFDSTCHTQSALLEVLHATIPFVEKTAILTATLPLTSRVLRALITSSEEFAALAETKDELGGMNATLRLTCNVATEFMKRLDSSGDNKAVKQMFQGTLLKLFRDRRAKVRKAAVGGASELLLMEEPTRCHPAITKTSNNHVRSELTNALRRTRDESDRLDDILQLIPFIEQSILALDFPAICAEIMQLISALTEIDVTSAMANSYVAVGKVRENTPRILAITLLLSTIASTLENDSQRYSVDLNDIATKVLASLLQIKPTIVFREGAADYETVERGRTVFGHAIITACRRVINANANLACKLLPLVVQMVLHISKASLEAHEDSSTADSLFVELTQVFRMDMTQLTAKGDALMVSTCMDSVLSNMRQLLQPVYSRCWPASLKCLVVLVQHWKDSSLVPDLIEALVSQRSRVVENESVEAVDDAISTLTQGVGLEILWSWIRWNKDEKGITEVGIDTSRAWILATIKSAAIAAQPCQPKLAFFQMKVLELARVCDRLAAKGGREKFIHRSRVVDLWGLFPCFCNCPTDLSGALPTLTATLCRAIEDKRYPELVPIVCSGIRLLVNSTKESNSAEAVYPLTTKVLPVLFKLVSESSSDAFQAQPADAMNVDSAKTGSPQESSKMHLQSIIDTISVLAVVAPKTFLQSLFSKLMHRLLESIQSGTPDDERVCSLLNLTQGLVGSRTLEASNIEFVYKGLKPLIRSDEYSARIQKRAYKVLLCLCKDYHDFIVEPGRLKEMTGLITGTIMTSSVAARQMRLQCMQLVVDGFDPTKEVYINQVAEVIPEVLLCLKDANGKAREAAYQLLLSIARRMDMGKYIHIVAAGLGAETSHMRSAAVMALSRIVFELAWENQSIHNLLPQMLRTVLLLIDENSREVVKSVVGFIRVSVTAVPPDQLQLLLPELVNGLLRYHKAKLRFRTKIKIILKKLVKRFGYDELMPFVPQSETRLLTHMRKLEERQKRRKDESSSVKAKDEDGFDEMLESDEEDSDNGRTFITGATGFSRMTSRSGANKSAKSVSSASKTIFSIKSKGSKSVKLDTTLLPSGADGQIVDMLGHSVMKQVRFVDQTHADEDSSGEIQFDDNGRLIIVEHDHNEAVESETPESNKRRRVSKFEAAKAERNSKGVKNVKEIGAAYKAKKAGGDVKLKHQKFEPYAFMPLDGKSYSKKNRRAAVEQMSSVVRKGGKRKRN